MQSHSRIATLCLLLLAQPAHAVEPDPFHITDAEKAACSSDAMSLCSAAYPDENRLLTCMKANHASLSGACATVFDAGMKRRHMSVTSGK